MTTSPHTWRAIAPWYIVEFANSAACTLLTIGCYDFAHHHGAAPSTVLWLSAGWGLAYVFIALVGGKLTESFGPRRTVLLMSALSCVAALGGLAALAVPAPWMLLLVMFFYNVTSTTVWPGLESGLSRTRIDVGRVSLPARLALYNLSWGFSGFVALFFRGALESAWWGLIFVVPAAIHALAVITLWIGGPPASAIGKEHVPADPEIDADKPDPARARMLLFMAWTGNALAYVAINVLSPLLQKIASAAGRSELVSGGMLTSAWSFSRSVGFVLLWVWVGWHYRTRYLLLAQAVLAATFCIMLTVHSQAVFVVAQIVFGLAIAMVYSGALYYAMHVSSGHGGHAGMHEALIGLGIALGPSIGALSGAGEPSTPGANVEALHRIAWGVTALLTGGVIAMAFMARKATKRFSG
jgi:MFS family permease